MIKVNELRIGNLVLRRGIEEDVFTLGTSTINGKPEHNFVPIPLTPEILEKCGFKKDDLSYDYDLTEDIHFNDAGDVYYTYWEGSDSRGGIEKKIIATVKYLHQLQNLYFALTWKELTITL
jgi:hypothetical protein